MADRQPTHRAAASLRRRILLILALRWTVRLAAAWCFAWGVAVLVCRAVPGMDARPLVWGLAGLAPCAAGAAALAWRRTPSPRAVRAVLDRASRSGGLVMAEAEVALGPWASRVPALAVPAVHWRLKPATLALLAAVAFVVFSFAIPQRFVEITSSRPLQVADEVAALAEQLQVLEEEQILAAEEARSLEQSLKQTAEQAAGEDPAKTWEALDHLQDAVRTAAAVAAETALGQREAAGKAEALARALAAETDGLDAATLAAAMKELGDLLEKAAKDGPPLDDAALKEALADCQAGDLATAECMQLADRLAMAGEILKARLLRLQAVNLIEIDALKLGDGWALDPADLIALLEGQGGDGMEPDLLIQAWLAGVPGRGGISRGRADAPLIQGDASSADGLEFVETVLPPPTVADLKESHLLGVTLGAPSVESGGPGSGGALAPSSAGAGGARTHRVLPKHQPAVMRYFQREGEGAGRPAASP